jgi:hypothetical protein
MDGESTLLNTWWNQHCTDPLMEAPASASHVGSGIDSRATFTHHPKDVVHVEYFLKLRA